MPNTDRNCENDTAGTGKVLIWDWPIRTFHWLLVILVTISFVSGKAGGNAMQIHMWSGYTILALLIFRVIWGVIGGRFARFSSFVRGPAAVWRYARSLMHPGHSGRLGHNPLGGWSIVAMLLSLLVQAVTGLFADDQIFTQGPLYPWVSNATSRLLTRIHLYNQWVILALIGLHVLAVFFYLVVKGDNLITPMVTGRKPWNTGFEAPADPPRTLAAVIAAVLSAAAVLLLVR